MASNGTLQSTRTWTSEQHPNLARGLEGFNMMRVFDAPIHRGHNSPGDACVVPSLSFAGYMDDVQWLSLSTFAFPYALILIESSDAWPSPTHPVTAQANPPGPSRSWCPRGQRMALGTALARRMQSLPRQVALQCVPLPRSHAAACSHCLGMPQPCSVPHAHQ